MPGLAFLRGIPGAIGGALRMNGGAYEGETKDVLVEARAVDRQGRIHTLNNADMHYTYRHCGAPEDFIFTEATFEGTPGDRAAIAAEMDKITESREATQPIKSRTGGSTFKNPPGQKAWQLIDAAGCRGLIVGGAQVSELHCNFLINLGTATAADIETLGETVRRARERQLRRRAGMGNQADRQSGLTVWRDEQGFAVAGFRNRRSRLFTKPKILIPEIRAESFLSRPRKLRCAHAPRADSPLAASELA